MTIDYARYCDALQTLAALDDRAAEERSRIDKAAAVQGAELDREWRTGRAEFDRVAEQRNRVQRDVVALCRDVGSASPQAVAAGMETRLDVREISAGLDDVERRTERARRDWRWAQGYLERSRAAVPAAPVRLPPPPPIAAPAPPEPKPAQNSRMLVAVGAGVLLLILAVLIVLVML